MQQTEKLGLYTWAGSDPVDVSQINDNFTKIDNATYLEKLLDTTTEEAATIVNLDLSSIDAKLYSAIFLHFRCSLTAQTSISARLNNNSSRSYYTSEGAGSKTITSPSNAMTLLPTSAQGGAGLLKLYAMSINSLGVLAYGFAWDTADLKYIDDRGAAQCGAMSELKTIQLFSSSTTTIPAGARILIYGVRE